MNKGFVKISALFSVIALAFIAGVLLFSQSSVKNAVATYNNNNSANGCEYSCPAVEFSRSYYVYEEDFTQYGEWSAWGNWGKNNSCSSQDENAGICDDEKRWHDGPGSGSNNDYWEYRKKTRTINEHACPAGYEYHEQNGSSDDCRKLVNFSATVQYEKSQDPTKCHRPSDDELEDVYGMDHATRQAFKQANSEWKNSTIVVPDGYYQEGNACFAKTPVCANDSATNYGGQDGQFDSNKEVANNDLCEYSQTHVCTDPAATNYDSSVDSQTEVADNAVCTYPGVTPVDVCSNIDDVQTEIPAGYHMEEGLCVEDENEEEPKPTVEPTQTPSNPGGNGDGLGCAVRDCSGNQVGGPATSNQAVLGTSTQAVLGASTMAKTGGFTGTLMNIYAIFGMLLVAAGFKSYAKEKNLI